MDTSSLPLAAQASQDKAGNCGRVQVIDRSIVLLRTLAKKPGALLRKQILRAALLKQPR
ncbi:hypothetical protein [Pseudomonas sp.]|uniref:hypothetical protein n=1 Tax=Pseudomonas sp. TaxID=306 RepID=UPI0023552BA8|nr:hypothetical protein [Pseudomonas sp.]